MAKIIAVLLNDIAAKAGQVLLVDDTGKVYAADPARLEVMLPVNKFEKLAEPVKIAAPVLAPQTEREKQLTHMKDLLLRNTMTTGQIAEATGVARGTVCTYRVRMVRDGLLPSGKFRKSRKPHHHYRSIETLQAARARGAAMAAVRKAKQMANP